MAALRRIARAGRLAGGAALLLAAGPPQAAAHVVYDRATLRQYVQHSAVSVVAEIASPLRVHTAPGGGDRQEYFRARTLEVLAGPPPPPVFDFFPHAEGLPAFREGDRALVFLERTAERPELAALAGRLPWYSVQEAGEEWTLAPHGEAVLDLARGYVAWLRAAEPGAAGLRRLLLRGLASPAPRLRADALSELVRARRAPGLLSTPEDVAPFATLARSGPLEAAQRVALVRLLEGSPGFDADAQLRAMTAEPLEPGDARALARAAGASRDRAVSGWLAGLLEHEDAVLRRDAAGALGRPWHGAHAGALARAAADPDPAVARAAVHALAGIGNVEALERLRALAAGGGRVAALAAAELRRLGVPGPGARE